MRTSDFLKTSEGSKYLLCDGSAIPSSYTKLKTLMTHTPDLRDRVPQGSGAYSVGSQIEAALPNITGSVTINYSMPITISGALYSWTGVNRYSSSGGTNGNNGLAFDASRCSSIYKNGCTTVQPPALAVAFYIKAK